MRTKPTNPRKRDGDDPPPAEEVIHGDDVDDAGGSKRPRRDPPPARDGHAPRPHRAARAVAPVGDDDSSALEDGTVTTTTEEMEVEVQRATTCARCHLPPNTTTHACTRCGCILHASCLQGGGAGGGPPSEWRCPRCADAAALTRVHAVFAQRVRVGGVQQPPLHPGASALTPALPAVAAAAGGGTPPLAPPPPPPARQSPRTAPPARAAPPPRPRPRRRTASLTELASTLPQVAAPVPRFAPHSRGVLAAAFGRPERGSISREATPKQEARAGCTPPRPTAAPRPPPSPALRRCTQCGSTSTPQWRRGPAGPSTLCNACGLKFASEDGGSSSAAPSPRAPSAHDRLPSQPRAPPGRCVACATTETTQWRSGPNGPRTLCNACGAKWRRFRESASAAATAAAPPALAAAALPPPAAAATAPPATSMTPPPSADDALEYLVTFTDRAPLHAAWVPAPLARAVAATCRPLRRRLDAWTEAVRGVVGPPGVATVAPDPWEALEEEEGGAGGGGSAGAPTRPRARTAPPSLIPGLPDAWVTVGRALATRPSGKGGVDVLVKWAGLPHDHTTWEPAPVVAAAPGGAGALDALAARVPIARRVRELAVKAAPHARPGGRRFAESPAFLGGGPASGLTLHPYQLDGFNWMLDGRVKGDNLVLADEMGLGKTIQAAAYIATVALADACPRPHLVVAPLSTVGNWVRELEAWAPSLVVVGFVGNKAARSIVKQYDLFGGGGGGGGAARPAGLDSDDDAAAAPLLTLRGSARPVAPRGVNANPGSDSEATLSVGPPPPHAAPPPSRRAATARAAATTSRTAAMRAHVVVTSYETVTSELDTLASVQWASLVVDEAHRLRSTASRLFASFASVAANHRLLLTGTPLQNALGDLFGLLQFLDGAAFDRGALDAKFGALPDDAARAAALRDLLAPRLLRRVKKDVLTQLPPKRDVVVRVELAAAQKLLYKAILSDSAASLAGGAAAADPAGGGRAAVRAAALRNVLMQLRKACVHPYLVRGVEDADEEARKEDEPETAAAKTDRLVAASGKLALLDRMVPRLIAGGHRVLIYSQFKGALDILGEWATARGHGAARLDGDTPGPARQAAIDAFAAHPARYPLFLLSTRAGGLGLNLVGADTVIIFDADWNPQADRQAAARAHRHGQTAPVMVYRFVTRATVEERMAAVAARKLALERAVVRGAVSVRAAAGRGEAVAELDAVLRHGAAELFAEEEDKVVECEATAVDAAAAPTDAAPSTARARTTLVAQEAAAGRTGGDDGRRMVWDDAALDALLNRDAPAGATAVDSDDEGGVLGEFKTARFEAEDDEEEDGGDGEGDDTGDAPHPRGRARRRARDADPFWSTLLAPTLQAAAAELGKGKRRRAAVDYTGADAFAGLNAALGVRGPARRYSGSAEGAAAADARPHPRHRPSSDYEGGSDPDTSDGRCPRLGASCAPPPPPRAPHPAAFPPEREAWLADAIAPDGAGGRTVFGVLAADRSDVDGRVAKNGVAAITATPAGHPAHAYAVGLARLLASPPGPRAAEVLTWLLHDAGQAGSVRRHIGAIESLRLLAHRMAVNGVTALVTPGGRGEAALAAALPRGTPPSAWGPRHDVGLVAGVMRHGFGAWTDIQADPAVAAVAVGAAALAGARVVASADAWLEARARALAAAAALDAADAATPSAFALELRDKVMGSRLRDTVVAWAQEQASLRGLAAAAGVE